MVIVYLPKTVKKQITRLMTVQVKKKSQLFAYLKQ